MQDIWVVYFIDPDLEIMTDSDGAVTSIFFQEGHMKKFLSLYPELLMLDATYKLTNVRMPLYVMLCVGPNGESEIVAVFLTVREDAPTLCEALDRFKSRNPHWNNICTVMTDKDLAEREAVKQKFPQVALMLCLFHVLRAMSREVTTSKMSITEEQRGRALQALQGLAYAKSDEEYNSLRESFRTSMPQTVVQYYEANWHTCRHEWVLCWQRQNVTFGERTNNRLESVNKRLKAVIKNGSSLPNFFKDLIAMLACMRMERHHTILSVTDKVSVKHYPVGSARRCTLLCRLIIGMRPQDVTAEKPATVDNLQLEPTELPAILINTDINIDELKPLLTPAAWYKLQESITVRAELNQWYCACCKNDLDSGRSIECSSCLDWYHYSCVGLKRSRKGDWFCCTCP